MRLDDIANIGCDEMVIITRIVMTIFVVCCGVGIISLLWSIYYSIRLIFQFSNPSNAFSKYTIWNPMNAIFNPRLLSPKGLNFRRKILRGCLIFSISFSVAVGIAVALQLASKFLSS